MVSWGVFSGVVAGALAAKCAVQLWLERLNCGNVRAHADRVPAAFEKIVDPPTYARMVEYTLAKSRFHQFELLYNALLLAVVLMGGPLGEEGAAGSHS